MTDLSPIVNATNALVGANQRLSDILTLLEDTYSGFPPGVETVVTFGAGQPHATFEELWNDLKSKTIAGPLRVQVPDGIHVIDKRLVVGPHPWARNIRFIGNLLSPANCTFQILDGPVDDDPTNLNGIHLVGMQGCEWSGFTFIGTGNNSTSLGFTVEDGSYVFSQTGTVRFQNLDLGFYVNASSAWTAQGIAVNGCLNGGLVGDGALLRTGFSSFSGRGYNNGVGLRAADASVVQGFDCDASDYKFGYFASSSAHMGIAESRADNCVSGFLSRAANIWNYGVTERVDIGAFRCRQGFDAESGGRIFAPNNRSENCLTPLQATDMSFIEATSHRVVEDNTGVVPDYSATAYFFTGTGNSVIRASGTTWTKVRADTYKSLASDNSIIAI